MRPIIVREMEREERLVEVVVCEAMVPSVEALCLRVTMPMRTYRTLSPGQGWRTFGLPLMAISVVSSRDTQIVVQTIVFRVGEVYEIP